MRNSEEVSEGDMREFFFPSHCEGSTNEDCAQLQT